VSSGGSVIPLIGPIALQEEPNAMEDNKIDGGEGVRNTSLFAKYANEITAITTSAAAAVATTDRRRRKSNKIVDEHRPPESIADVIAFTAKQNLTSMKSNVDKTLQEVTYAQHQLSNYQQFIEKKRLQRIQCVRDIKSHCCKCQGPHIAKPPFCCNSKNHRRDPIHTLRQGANCKFLKRKRAELKWLDETIYKYPMNEKRFEQQIVTFEEMKEAQKEEMKEALANSLRLMEIAVDLPTDFD
jgi:hypothetical protein